MRSATALSKISLTLAAMAVTGALYFTPQFLYQREGHPGAVLLAVDEAEYMARLTRVMQGRWTIGNPWTFEGREDMNPVPPLPEIAMGMPARVLGMNPDQAVSFWRAVLPALGVLALAWALQGLGAGVIFSLFVAVWVYCDPGLMAYKPLGDVYAAFEFLPLNRFSNPLFGLLLFMLAWGAGVRAYFEKRESVAWSIGAGALIGLTFYTSIYYWTHLVLAFFLATILTRGRWKQMGIGAAAAAIVSLPYWWKMLKLQAHPVYPYLGWRNGILIEDRGLYLLPHKSLWAMAIVALGAVWYFGRRDERQRFLFASILAGMICYFSPLFTGISIQNFHYHYTLAPMVFAGVFWAVKSGIAASPLASSFPRTLAGITLVLVLAVLNSGFNNVFAFYDALKAQKTSGMGLVDHDYGEAWRWLRRNAPQDSVVLAGELVMPMVPGRSGLRAWVDPHLVIALTPFEEVLERNHLLWALEGYSVESLREKLTPPNPLPVAQWNLGLTRELLAELDKRGRPIFDHSVGSELAWELARNFDKLSAQEIASAASRYRLDYLVRGPHESGWGSRPEGLLKLKPVGTFGDVRIDQVLGFKR